MAGHENKQNPKNNKPLGQLPSSLNGLAWEVELKGNTPVSVPTPDAA